MWSLYDELIEGIPSDIKVKDVNLSPEWAIVSTEDSCGLGVVYDSRTVSPLFNKDWRGESLKDLAACIKSWHLPEAALGNAAITCYYNSQTLAEKNGIVLGDPNNPEIAKNNPFNVYQEAIKGKKVAVVGHFPYLEKLFAPYCDLYVLDERNIDGDYPIQAAEYILPEVDYAFLSCGYFVQKRLPRLLELAKDAYTTVVGPCTPLTPELFKYGISDLSGFIVRDTEKAIRISTGGLFTSVYKSGKKVHLTKEMLNK